MLLGISREIRPFYTPGKSIYFVSKDIKTLICNYTLFKIYLIFLEPPLPYRNTSLGEENVTGGSGGASGKEREAKRLEHGPRPQGSPSW